jgi:hypothetical protein
MIWTFHCTPGCVSVHGELLLHARLRIGQPLASKLYSAAQPAHKHCRASSKITDDRWQQQELRCNYCACAALHEEVGCLCLLAGCHSRLLLLTNYSHSVAHTVHCHCHCHCALPQCICFLEFFWLPPLHRRLVTCDERLTQPVACKSVELFS